MGVESPEQAIQVGDPDADAGQMGPSSTEPGAGVVTGGVPPQRIRVPEPDWPALIDGILSDPRQLSLVFQPIVNLAEATVVGYEALARFAPQLFPGSSIPRLFTPDRWFAAADEVGCGAELEAIVVRRCLALRLELPPDCFLTVNISPHLLTDPLISGPLLNAGPLAPLIVELTEHKDVPDLTAVIELRDQLAGLGGLIALDDAGSGYSGLQQMTRVRPHLIKLDRALVAGIDQDETKIALAELLGEFAGRIDAWLLAEGVETWEEAETFLRMGVPLAQGFLFGRPAPPWAGLDPQLAARLREANAQASLIDHVASLVERTPFRHAGQHGENEAEWSSGLVIEVDGHERPTGILTPRRDGTHLMARLPVSLRVAPSESVVAAARRLVARPAEHRFDPLVCVDEQGAALGVIRVERILTRLASPHVRGTGDDH